VTIQRPETEDAPPPARARPGRAADYRLRGLDLDAYALAETPAGPERKKHPSRRYRRRRLLIQWVAVLAVTAAVAVALRVSVVQPFTVRSTSMVPTLQAGTGVLVVKPSFLTGSVKTGDVVVVDEPAGFDCNAGGETSRHLVKRVIGLPGETIWSVSGSIFVDGRPLDEPGWYNPPYGEVGATDIVRTTLPAGSYFVMGDNRTDSCDSRAFGPVPKSAFVGKVVATITRNGHPFFHSL
jgi:signal peptidase I